MRHITNGEEILNAIKQGLTDAGGLKKFTKAQKEKVTEQKNKNAAEIKTLNEDKNLAKRISDDMGKMEKAISDAMKKMKKFKHPEMKQVAKRYYSRLDDVLDERFDDFGIELEDYAQMEIDELE